jgi:hypothetical protein
MSGNTCTTRVSLQSAVTQAGFAFAHGDAMREILSPHGSLSDWDRFAASWADLEVDTYMADGGRYRRRRYAVYAADDVAIHRASHQPHFQALDYNPLNGGIARWYTPVAPEVGDGPTMRTILGFVRSFFGDLAPQTRAWRVEVHQFRIEAGPGAEGQPTPEGLHRDGVDYVLVLLIRRRNIASGTTSIHGLEGHQLGDFTLTDPLDAALLDDSRVFHGVTPVQALDPALPAYRDVLVVTLRSEPG